MPSFEPVTVRVAVALLSRDREGAVGGEREEDIEIHRFLTVAAQFERFVASI